MHKQRQHFTNILNENFVEAQIKNTRHISPPRTIPQCHIHITECNPDNDIAYTQPTIQSQHGASHFYAENGRHLITIPEQKLHWLWGQYQNALHQSHNLEPPIQSFEKKSYGCIKDIYIKYPKLTPSNFPNTHYQTTSLTTFWIHSKSPTHTFHPQ